MTDIRIKAGFDLKEFERAKALARQTGAQISSMTSVVAKLGDRWNRTSKKQQDAIRAARKEVDKFNQMARKSGANVAVIQKNEAAFNRLANAMTSGKLRGRDFENVMKGLKNTLRENAGAANTASAGIRKVGTSSSKAAKDGKGFSTVLGNVGSSAVLAFGPLSGIGSRIIALAAIAKRGAAPLGLISGAVSALALGFGKTVAAGAALERQMFKIEAVLKATGTSSGLTIRQIDNLSREIARGTLASTAQVRDAAAALLTFRDVSGDTFKDALRLSQDLAALGFGSVRSAAVQLGKALQDPKIGLQGLRRVGVDFTQSQKDMITELVESGNKAEAMRVILKGLQEQVGGAGTAEAGGLSGAWDSLNQEILEFFELLNKNTNLTSTLASGLKGITGGIRSINEQLSPEGRNRDLEARLKLLKDLEKTTKKSFEGTLGFGREKALKPIQDQIKQVEKLIGLNKLQIDLQKSIEASEQANAKTAAAAQAARAKAEAERIQKQEELEKFAKEVGKAFKQSESETNRFLESLRKGVERAEDPVERLRKRILELRRGISVSESAADRGLFELGITQAIVADARRRAPNAGSFRGAQDAGLQKGLDKAREMRTKREAAATREIAKATREREAAQRFVNQILRESLGPQEKYQQQQEKLNILFDKGLIGLQQYEQAMASINTLMAENNPLVQLLGNQLESLASSFVTVFTEGASASEVFKNAIRSLIGELLQLIIKLTIVRALKQALGMGGGGGIGGLFSIFGGGIGAPVSAGFNPGMASAFSGLGTGLRFNTGGNFQVGGAGGADSQFVSFMATPGETVNVSRPGEQMSGTGGGGDTIVQNISVSAGVSQTVRAEMMALLPRFKEEAVNAVIDKKKRNPGLFK